MRHEGKRIVCKTVPHGHEVPAEEVEFDDPDDMDGHWTSPHHGARYRVACYLVDDVNEGDSKDET